MEKPQEMARQAERRQGTHSARDAELHVGTAGPADSGNPSLAVLPRMWAGEEVVYSWAGLGEPVLQSLGLILSSRQREWQGTVLETSWGGRRERDRKEERKNTELKPDTLTQETKITATKTLQNTGLHLNPG